MIEDPQEMTNSRPMQGGKVGYKRWPLEMRDKAKRFVVDLGYSCEATSNEIGVPADTIRQWAAPGKWIDLRAKAYKRREELHRAKIEAPIQIPKEEPEVSQEEVKQDRISETLAQIDRLDRAMRKLQDDDPAVLKFVEAKAKLWALVHSKPQPARGRRSKPPLQPLTGGSSGPDTPHVV